MPAPKPSCKKEYAGTRPSAQIPNEEEFEHLYWLSFSWDAHFKNQIAYRRWAHRPWTPTGRVSWSSALGMPSECLSYRAWACVRQGCLQQGLTALSCFCELQTGNEGTCGSQGPFEPVATFAWLCGRTERGTDVYLVYCYRD